MPTLQFTSDSGFAFVTTGMYNGQLLKTDPTGSLEWLQYEFLIAVDAIESYDKGFVTIGNGPIFGVKMAPTDNPQIGIIKSDSLGYSVDCADYGANLSSDFESDFIPDTISSLFLDVNITDLHPEISNSSLELFVGCVAFIGGVAEMETPVFTILPNPSSGSFQIQINDQQDLNFNKLNIYNTEGKVVFQSTDATVLQNTIDLHAQPNGMYFAQIVFQKGTFSQKFIVQH